MKKKEIVKKLVNKELEYETQNELLDLLNRKMAVDIDKKHREKQSFGDKMADKISSIVGSWIFIISFISFLLFWIILNLYILETDPFPFILLNLVLSCVAAVQAPIIVMSQNRESKRESMRSQNDYIVDLKSELILEDLHRKIELILKTQAKLIEIYEKEE